MLVPVFAVFLAERDFAVFERDAETEPKAALHFDPGKEYSRDSVQGQKIYGHYGVPTYWA